ncbi:MAG: ATPase [Candidatus Cloacimonas sp. 4484_143]|nr:MAG: ATPase [Candidatus Cloacimonas sp. 4484_143]
MKKLIAIPIANGRLCAHFGHCEKFWIFATENGKIKSDELITPPPHEPGLLPRFLGEKGVNAIIAGGMGSRAQGLFSQNSIDVYFGVEVDEPKNLVQKLLNNTLVSGVNLCDH